MTFISDPQFVACFGLAAFFLFLFGMMFYSHKSLKEVSGDGCLTKSYQVPPPPKPSSLPGEWCTKVFYGPDFIILHRYEDDGELAVRTDKIAGFFREEGEDGDHSVIQYSSGDYTAVSESFEEIAAALELSKGAEHHV